MSSGSTQQVTIWNTAHILKPCSTAVTIRTTCILSARRIYVSLNSINHLVFVTQTAACLVSGKNECLYIIYINLGASKSQNCSVRFHETRSPDTEHCCTILCLRFRAALIYINNCPTWCNTEQFIYYSASSLYMFRVSATLIIKDTQNCNYSLRYWSATSLQHGPAWPSWRGVAAQKIWPVLEAVFTVLCTPGDGCGWHPKHVKWTRRIINRLLCVATRWTIIASNTALQSMSRLNSSNSDSLSHSGSSSQPCALSPDHMHFVTTILTPQAAAVFGAVPA